MDIEEVEEMDGPIMEAAVLASALNGHGISWMKEAIQQAIHQQERKAMADILKQMKASQPQGQPSPGIKPERKPMNKTAPQETQGINQDDLLSFWLEDLPDFFHYLETAPEKTRKVFQTVLALQPVMKPIQKKLEMAKARKAQASPSVSKSARRRANIARVKAGRLASETRGLMASRIQTGLDRLVIKGRQ